MISLIAIMVLVLATSISAAYYCDKDGNLVEAGSENIAYEFDVGGDRNIDGNKCFRISAIYLHDTSLTKIVFPVASQVKSGYDGIAPQGNWSMSLEVYSVDKSGVRNTETSYATQIQEVEFLSGADFDGANGKGAFSGFTALTKMVFNGNVSMGNDATNKGGMFNNAPITDIVIKGSGNVNLVITRHISTSNNLKVVFDKNCTSHVYVVRGSRHFLSSASISNWTFIFNPNITFGVYSSDLIITPACEKGTPTTKFIMAVDDENNVPEGASSHGLLYSNENQTQIATEIIAWCELGYAEHVNTTTVEYANGFASTGVKTVGCGKCNEIHTENLDAIFECIGYSVPEDNRIALAVDYSINKNALGEYKALNDSFEYGVFGVLADKIGTNELFKEDGELTTKAICAELTDEISAVTLKITGFTTEEHKALDLAMGIYVKETVEGQTKYTYIQSASPEEGQKYSTISYNEVSQ